ncbi:MAG: leucine-rich repeat domain-containing protein, partial [Thermoguttaceae bacterium]|nr:leucine-rich repeat domain-containing protein [Thermoguttaceae bacterium]
NLGKRAFSDNRRLKRVSLPALLKKLAAETFLRCAVLSEIKFSQGLEVIGNAAFSHCAGLSTVELPLGLRKLGARAFENCKTLETVVLPPTLAEIGPDAFAETSDNLTLYGAANSFAEQYARDAGLRFQTR